MSEIPHPPIASKAEWLAARLELLQREKAHTQEYDRINAQRRRLPMVLVEKDYIFEGADGPQTLAGLFGEYRQLIVYHFMFDPAWEDGCSGCTWFIDSLGDLSTLAKRDTGFVLVSKAPFAKLEAYRKKRGWPHAWFSSGGGDFNLDFGVTYDPSRGASEYNYRLFEGQMPTPAEFPGLSVFFRLESQVFHTYSAFARGVENLTDASRLLDATPYGRQEDFEDSPPGWPQRPTYG